MHIVPITDGIFNLISILIIIIISKYLRCVEQLSVCVDVDNNFGISI